MRASTNKTLPVPLSASSSSSSPAPRGALARALSALRLDSALHDYDTFTDDAVEERVTMLGIHEADIAGLCDLCPGVQIRRVRPGGEDFWRIDAWLPKRTLGSVRTWGDGVGVEPDTCRVLADACDATGQVVLRAGQVVTVERRAERGEMKVCDLSGAGLGFALADTPVEVLGEAAALQALADYYSPGAWRVHPAPGAATWSVRPPRNAFVGTRGPPKRCAAGSAMRRTRSEEKPPPRSSFPTPSVRASASTAKLVGAARRM